jgi:hypothetical protein
MEFDWINPAFELDPPMTYQEVEESFEDPFSIRLLPDSPRFGVQGRFFNLGKSATGQGLFSVYRANGKVIRVIHRSGNLFLSAKIDSGTGVLRSLFYSNGLRVYFCLGGCPALRQRAVRGHFLVRESSRLKVNGIIVGAQFRTVRIDHDYLADGSPNVESNQAPRPLSLSQLPKHDQTMDERTDGKGIEGSMNLRGSYLFALN